MGVIARNVDMPPCKIAGLIEAKPSVARCVDEPLEFRGVMIPLFTRSKSGSRISEGLKIRLRTWIQGRNHRSEYGSRITKS